MAPQAALEAGVILGAGEEITHELAKNGAATEELHHARGDCGAEKRAAVKAAHHAGGEFELAGKRGFDTRGVFFGTAFGECATEKLAGTHRVEQTFAGERIDPGGGVADHGPVFSNYRALRKSAFLGRRENVAVEPRAFGRDILLVDESVQVRAKLGAVVRRHAAADSDGKMVAAGEGPDVAFELRKKLYDDGLGSLRDEITLGHFEFVALKSARFRMKVIASASGEHEKISG